jgi:uncharacterized protein DUF4082/fibronectin type III domain protein
MHMDVPRQVAAVRWTAFVARITPLLAGLFSLAHDAHSVTLAWDVDADPTVVGYRLYYGTSSGSDTQSTDVANMTTATISNLAVGYTYFFAVRAYNAFGLESPPSNEVSFTPTANPALPASSFFSASNTPATIMVKDANPVELGVKFQTATAGQVIGARFYKGPQNTGTHVANLWSATGGLLATAVFTNETASGWQQVSFSSPITLTPGMTYVVSYHTNGFYSADANYFAAAHTSAPLTAPASGSSGGDGVYAYGNSSSFPTNTYKANNYWVDVVFTQFP